MKAMLSPLVLLLIYFLMAWVPQRTPVQSDAYPADLAYAAIAMVAEPTYVGSQTCIDQCHETFHPELVAEYVQSGHPYKLNEVNGGPPVYPANTSPGPMLPPGTTWNDFRYTIGGYGWKARFVRPNGHIYTSGDSAQYNLPHPGLERDESWAAYHKGEVRKYNYACFQCHTTGASPEGSWNGMAKDSLGTFTEPGIRCEGCHGPGSEHAADPFGATPPITGTDLKITRCGDCHQRGGITNAIPASGGYIRHHEQLNEMRASRHGDGMNADLTCASCHDPHVTIKYPDVVGAGMAGITRSCESCHAGYEIMLDNQPKAVECIDCHMPRASKSAVGVQTGNGFAGDIRTHIMGINTSPLTRDAMFAEDGTVALDGEGLADVTMDFACLQCHTNKNVEWAANFAASVHTAGITTAIGDADLPVAYALDQNHPNPFNGSTVIRFELPQTSPVTLRLYSVDGRLIATMLQQTMPAGTHSATIDSETLASGTYLYELNAGTFVKTKTMTVIK